MHDDIGGRRGLSPRVRGNLRRSACMMISPGSIPACAGEPSTGYCYRCQVTVYPRVCGGTEAPPPASICRQGLSPRVRGNRRHQPRNLRQARSIPACAGEPISHPARRRYYQVYPRVCGGTSKGDATPQATVGLSPRVRGNRQERISPLCRPGSIPACAGEPRLGHRRPGGHRVYPRVCGGTCRPPQLHRLGRGLSPRVRGNPAVPLYRVPELRSIPACAGEPQWLNTPHRLHPVYPRVCGGTAPGDAAAAMPAGLSPRVRGNRHPANRC